MDDTNTVKCPLCRVDVPIDKIDLPNRCLHPQCPLKRPGVPSRSGNRTRSKRKTKLPPNGRGVLCPNACGHNGGVRKRADWRHHYAWNSEPDIRLGPNCEISSLAQRLVTTNRWSGWRRARADLKS